MGREADHVDHAIETAFWLHLSLESRVIVAVADDLADASWRIRALATIEMRRHVRAGSL